MLFVTRITGHHFLFGYEYLHSQNIAYVYDVISSHGGGILLESIIQVLYYTGISVGL